VSDLTFEKKFKVKPNFHYLKSLKGYILKDIPPKI